MPVDPEGPIEPAGAGTGYGASVLGVVAVGGALGSLARWSLATALPTTPGRFPWGTLLINLSGSLLIGAVMVVLLERFPATRYGRPALVVGVLGGYTTFSALALEVRNLVATDALGTAAAYLLASATGGPLACWLGIRTATAVLNRPSRP